MRDKDQSSTAQPRGPRSARRALCLPSAPPPPSVRRAHPTPPRRGGRILQPWNAARPAGRGRPAGPRGISKQRERGLLLLASRNASVRCRRGCLPGLPSLAPARRPGRRPRARDEARPRQGAAWRRLVSASPQDLGPESRPPSAQMRALERRPCLRTPALQRGRITDKRGEGGHPRSCGEASGSLCDSSSAKTTRIGLVGNARNGPWPACATQPPTAPLARVVLSTHVCRQLAGEGVHLLLRLAQLLAQLADLVRLLLLRGAVERGRCRHQAHRGPVHCGTEKRRFYQSCQGCPGANK